MADTRIMLTCKHCGAGMCIGKGYDGSYYTVNKNMFHDLNAFYEVHEKGKCSDDADYSQDAKNHFVILEEGETLADVASKSEGEWQIKTVIHQMIDDVDEELYVECPFCQRTFWVPYEFEDEKIFEYAREHYPYCNCGARMKGGAG